MSNDMVSIIVPVYNAANCIADTILSVKSQTYTNYELLLCDDASTDESIAVMEKYACDNIMILPKGSDKKGAAGARNRGIRNARGRYVAFLDADDLWDPQKLEKQVAFMTKADCAFSFTGYEFADENGVGMGKIVRVPKEITYKQALGNTTIFTSTVMFDLDKLAKDDIFMPYVKSEDTATWWSVLKKFGTAFGLDEALTMYRRQSGTLSSNKIEAVRRIWNLYRQVEKLSLLKSCYYFCLWAVRAVIRRV